MPFVVICPECDAQLKSNALIPAGRTITCPSCKTKFTTERDSKEIGGGSKASVNVPPAPKPKAKPSRDEDEDFEDEDDNRPPVKKKAKASRNEDEDFDEEEDERPKKKASKNRDYDDEEEDDRPAKKKASKNRAYDDEDDEEEDRPRSKKKGKKKKPQKSKLPWILGLAGGGGVALIGIVMLVLFLTDTYPFSKKDKNVVNNNNPPQGGGPNNPNPPGGETSNPMLDALKYVPTNTKVVTFIDLEKMRADPMFVASANKMAQSFTFGALEQTDIARIGIFQSGKGKDNTVVVLQLTSSFNRSAYDQKIITKPTTINGVQVYERNMGITYFADPQTLVLGMQLAPIIGKPQTAHANLQEFARNATGVMAVCVNDPTVDNVAGEFLGTLNTISGPGGQPQAQTQWVWISGAIKPTTLEATETRYYANEATAKSEYQSISAKLNAAKQNQATIIARVQSGQLKVKQTPEELKSILETSKVSQSGNKITIIYNEPKKADIFDDF